MKRTASDILNEIAGFYGITKDRDLAFKLGITATTLSNWRRRDTYDISVIVSRCQNIDINKLLRGLPLKPSNENHSQTSENENLVNEPVAIYKLIADKDKVIIQLAEQIGVLKEKLKEAQNKNE